MIIVYELAAAGAVAIAVVSIWHRNKLNRAIRSLDARLARMQKEIEILQIQESRRVMLALKGKTDVPSPGLDPADGDTLDIDDDVTAMIAKPRSTPVP